jgi:hypothetical protein
MRLKMKGLLILVGWAAVACELNTPNAPDNSLLQLIVPPNRLLAPGDSTAITALLKLETDDNAGAGWTIDMTVDRGGLGDSAHAITRGWTDGMGSVRFKFRSLKDTGWVHFTAVTFGARANDSIRIAPP